MSALAQAIALLDQRLTAAETIGQSLDLAGGEDAPPWVFLFREQISSIREASEALQMAVAGLGGNQ